MLDFSSHAELSPQAVQTLEHRFEAAHVEHPLMAALVECACLSMAGKPEPGPLDVVPAPEQEPAKPQGPPVDPVVLLQQDVKLPSLPEVIMELQKRIDSSSSSAQDMAEVISRDVGLAASLLRMVNSAFFSLPSQIETISRAVTVIGTRQLSTLALGTSVMAMFKDLAVPGMDMEHFWRHSIACGVIANAVAKRATMKESEGQEPERYFVAGLLHDLGRPVMLTALPDRAKAVLARASASSMVRAEQEVYGFDHARYGSMLLRKWNFPFFIVMAVLHHHDVDKAVQHIQAGVVHVANVMAQAMGYGTTAGYRVPPLHEPVVEALGLTPEHMREIVLETCDQLEDTCSIMAHESN